VAAREQPGQGGLWSGLIVAGAGHPHSPRIGGVILSKESGVNNTRSMLA